MLASPIHPEVVRNIDPSTAWLYAPHTISGLSISVFLLVRSSGVFSDEQPGPEASAANVERGVWGVVLLFLGYSVLQGPACAMIRPHPAVWRLVHGIVVIYLSSLVFLLFQTASDARQLLKAAPPAAQRPSAPVPLRRVPAPSRPPRLRGAVPVPQPWRAAGGAQLRLRLPNLHAGRCYLQIRGGPRHRAGRVRGGPYHGLVGQGAAAQARRRGAQRGGPRRRGHLGRAAAGTAACCGCAPSCLSCWSAPSRRVRPTRSKGELCAAVPLSGRRGLAALAAQLPRVLVGLVAAGCGDLQPRRHPGWIVDRKLLPGEGVQLDGPQQAAHAARKGAARGEPDAAAPVG